MRRVAAWQRGLALFLAAIAACGIADRAYVLQGAQQLRPLAKGQLCRRRVARVARQSAEPKQEEVSAELAFQRWSESLGAVISDKIELKAPRREDGSTSGYRGVFAARDLGVGDPVFPSMPLGMMMVEPLGAATPSDAPASELLPLWERWEGVTNARLAVRLLWRRQNGFQPYWDLLFRDKGEETLPWVWPQSAEPFLSAEFIEKCKLEEELVSRRLLEFRESAPASFSAEVTDQDFALAWSAVLSRCFSTEVRKTRIDGEMGLAAASCSLAMLGCVAAGAPAVLIQCLVACILLTAVVWLWRVEAEGQTEVSLMPWVDLVNHSGRATSVGAFMKFDAFQESFTFRALQNLAAGEELFLSYGPKGNDLLMRNYSFVEQDNPHDYVDIPLTSAACEEALSVEVRQKLQQLSGRPSLRFQRGGDFAAEDGMDSRIYSMGEERFEQAGVTREQLSSIVASFASGHPFGDSEEADSLLLEKVPGLGAEKVELLTLWRREKRRVLQEAVKRWCPDKQSP